MPCPTPAVGRVARHTVSARLSERRLRVPDVACDRAGRLVGDAHARVPRQSRARGERVPTVSAQVKTGNPDRPGDRDYGTSCIPAYPVDPRSLAGYPTTQPRHQPEHAPDPTPHAPQTIPVMASPRPVSATAGAPDLPARHQPDGRTRRAQRSRPEPRMPADERGHQPGRRRRARSSSSPAPRGSSDAGDHDCRWPARDWSARAEVGDPEMGTGALARSGAARCRRAPVDGAGERVAAGGTAAPG